MLKIKFNLNVYIIWVLIVIRKFYMVLLGVLCLRLFFILKEKVIVFLFICNNGIYIVFMY